MSVRPKEYFNAAVMAVALSTAAPHFVDAQASQQQNTQLAQTEPRLTDTEVKNMATIHRIERSLNAYWGRVFQNCGVDYKPVKVDPYDGTIDEASAYYVDVNEFARPSEQRGKIRINKPFFNTIIDENERHALLGHEMGHRVQDLQNRLLVRRMVEVENEADMLLGVYAKGLKNEGRLPERFMGAAILWLRSFPQDPRHGTTEQRVAAVRHGYEHGLPYNFCSRNWVYSANRPPDPSPITPPQIACAPGTVPTYIRGKHLWCRMPDGWIKR